jgi:uroporphyrin-III C-methyltransferase/precorrin-2 dehydrogenase/sirohydrochlorin ferrochelatase
MSNLPIFLDVKDRLVLVAGAGEIAARRAEAALDSGARVRLVGTGTCAALDEAAEHPRVERHARDFEARDLDGAALAFAATGDDALDERIARLARDINIPVNVADNLDLCTFVMPAIVDRGPVVIAIASGGESPVLSRVLKARLEALIPAGLGRLAAFAGAWRDKVRAALPDALKRRHFWEDVVDGPIAEFVLAGRDEAAEALLDKTLSGAARGPAEGEVYLVGAGPGDPDLLTFRALRLMQKADVVLHDRLVPDVILNLVRQDAERVFVGKRRGEHALPQADISKLMIKLARQGKRVLRLKSGDPFVFGRGGEEIEALAAEGIHFQVVPGVTAANGAAAYAGIPLTHRDHAQSCLFITGHAKDEKLSLDWKSLVRPNQTLVVYMGLQSLPTLIAELIAHGADPRTPAALVDNATRPGQRVITAPLGELAAHAAKADLPGPATVIVGSVVTLRDKLSWFRSSAAETAGPIGVRAASFARPNKN